MTKTLMQLLKWKWPSGVRNRNQAGEKSEKETRRRRERDELTKLYKIDEVDAYQRTNPYIRSGYRGPLDYASCLKSTVVLHNETINIWTHLIGFAFFAFLLVKDFFVIPADLLVSSASLSDLAVLTGVLLCYQACMIMSSLFHTFTCHSHNVSQTCLSLDLGGITLALLASYLSGIHYAFWCHDNWRAFYLVTVAGIFVVATGAQFHPKFAKEEYFHFRVALFMVWALYGLVPTVHYIFLHGGFGSSEPLVSALLPRIGIMYAICGVAFVFYIAKLPERWLPGTLDYFGHSHQWWHVLIFLALLFWHHTGVTLAIFRLSTGCTAPPKEEHLQLLSLI